MQVGLQPALPEDGTLMAICGRCQREMAETEFDPYDVIAAVCKRYGVTRRQVMGDNRDPHIVAARYEAYHEIRQQSGWSFPRIGRVFKRDHTMIIYGVNRHQERHGFEITE